MDTPGVPAVLAKTDGIQLPSAASRALGIAEILENILIYVAIPDIYSNPTYQNESRMRSCREDDPLILIFGRCALVSKFWARVICGSHAIARRCWLFPLEVHYRTFYDYPCLHVGEGTDIFEIFRKPILNYPFVSWLNWRLSKCFDSIIRPPHTKRTIRSELDHLRFGKMFLSNPPTTTAFIRFKVADSFLPGHKKPTGSTARIAFFEIEPPSKVERCTTNEGNWYTIIISNPYYITIQDVAAHFSSIMGLGRDAHIRDWLKVLEIGVLRPVITPDFVVPGYDAVIDTATTSGFMDFRDPTKLYHYWLKAGYPLRVQKYREWEAKAVASGEFNGVKQPGPFY